MDRRGEPAVIIMSVDDYLQTIAPEDSALKNIRDEAKRNGLDKLTMEDVDAEIAAYRREKRGQSKAGQVNRQASLDPRRRRVQSFGSERERIHR